MTLFSVSRFVSQCIGPPIQNGDYLQTSFMAILDHVLLNSSFIFHPIEPHQGLNQPGHPLAVIPRSRIFDFCSRLRRIPKNLKSSHFILSKNVYFQLVKLPLFTKKSHVRICFTYSSILSSNLVSYHLPVPKYNVFSNLIKTYTFC